ncbi:MAG: hypothetical protein KDN19_23695 [Verrucomicrobiae bacterium]|nr:hypothetical protein [Verrucomicrobiae bacterium]
MKSMPYLSRHWNRNAFLTVIIVCALSLGWQEKAPTQEDRQGLDAIPLDTPAIPELAAIEAQIDAEIREKAEIPYEADMKALGESYLAALAREMEVLKNSGDVDTAITVKLEIQDFASGKKVPATDGADVPPELEKLRDTYRREQARHEEVRDRRTEPLVESYDRLTADLEFQLTKEGRIEEAKALKKATALYWIKRSELAAISCDGDIEKFVNGTKAFSNRPYAWGNIPDYLPETSFVQNAGGAPEAREIKVLDPGVIFVAADTKNESDLDVLEELGFLKLPGGFHYVDAARSPMTLFAKVVDRPLKLPKASGFGGFVIIGDLSQ